MDRTNQQQPQQRDMVYCHQCENEWYRDEHGLTCPECQSDFTEIIEANHDPRDDHLPDLEPPDHDHGDYYGAPDPDEEDIDGFQWRQTAPGQMHGTFNRTVHLGGGRGGQQQGPQGGGLGGLFGGMLGSLLQGAATHVGQQQAQQGQAQQEQRPQSPDGGPGSRAASAPGTGRAGTTVRHYHGPLGHMTIATSSNVGGIYPRNANGPQPFQAQPNDIDQIMQQMVMNIGAFGPGGTRGMGGAPGGMTFAEGGMGGGAGGQHPFAAGPFANLFQMLGGMPGMGGDAVFSQEEMDRVITQLMEQNQTGHAPGPASEAAIKALPTKMIEQKDLGENGKAECTICMDEVQIGNTVTVLPCSHWFHGECIKAWLSEHDTCPHCRQGIMPKDEEAANRPRQSGQAPHNDMSNPTYPQQVPGGFPNAGLNRQESGTREHPFSVPESPSLHRRASSTSAAERRPSAARQSSGQQGSSGGSGGGMFKRMRDAFGGNGNGEGGAGGGPGAASS
ncbi:hypothetical protein LTR85_007966 [Meristemomyces frigidus]|nr:hypothetical protein LTR85_007966 [Meristemomyces frigidus]